MYHSLLEAFDEALGHVKFNAELAKSIYNYRVGYITQNRDHMEFFGGNLLGVQRVHFKTSDENKFFALLDVNYPDVTATVREVDGIFHTFKVGGDVINLTLMYLIHKFSTSRDCPANVRYQAAFDLALIFFYRCCAILLSAYFSYVADPKVAQAAYANLSKKYLIKQLGTWNKLMDYRAKALLDKSSPHYKTIMFFTEDSSITYLVTDSQSRIKEVILSYFNELMLVHESGMGIGVQKATVIGAEGDEELRAKTMGPEAMNSYMQGLLADPDSFVSEEFLKIIAKNNTNTSPRAIRFSLEWIAEQANQTKHHELINRFISMTVVQASYFMENNIEPSRRNNLAYVLTTLKNLFLSTRSEDPDLMQIREMGEKLIVMANGKLSKSLMMATRTAVIMYICLRALVGKNAK